MNQNQINALANAIAALFAAIVGGLSTSTAAAAPSAPAKKAPVAAAPVADLLGFEETPAPAAAAPVKAAPAKKAAPAAGLIDLTGLTGLAKARAVAHNNRVNAAGGAAPAAAPAPAAAAPAKVAAKKAPAAAKVAAKSKDGKAPVPANYRSPTYLYAEVKRGDKVARYLVCEWCYRFNIRHERKPSIEERWVHAQGGQVSVVPPKPTPRMRAGRRIEATAK